MREGKKKISLAALAGIVVLSGVMAVMDLAFVWYGIDTGIFSSDLKTALELGQKNLQSGYSKEIYNQMQKHTLQGYMEDSNLKYAVVKGRELSVEVLSDEKNYVSTNIENLEKEIGMPYLPSKFTHKEKFTEQNTYQFHQNLLRSIGDSGTVECRQVENGEGIYDDLLDRNLFYNYEDKILYFVGEARIYPVRRIQVQNKYVWSKENRRRYGMAEESVSSYTLLYSEDGKGRYQMWGEPRLSLNIDDFQEWQEFKVESGFLYHDASSVIRTGGLDYPKQVFENPTEEANGGYWIERDEEGYNLIARYKSDADLSVETWWVLSYVEEELNPEANDLFLPQQDLITTLYNVRYGLFGKMVLGGVCFVVCFVWGCRRRFAEAAVPDSGKRFFHRIPGLFYLGFWVGILAAAVKVGRTGWGLFWGYRDEGYSFSSEMAGAVLVVCCIALGIFVLWEVCGEIAYRAGAGSLWKNTVVYELKGCLERGARRARDTVREHGSLVSGAVLLMLGMVVLEALCLLVSFQVFQNMAVSLAVLFVLRLLEIFPGISIAVQLKKLQGWAQQMAEGNLEGTFDNSKMLWEFKKHGDYLNQISDGMNIAIEERMKSEHLRTELIANVSHDINTPLTSIINYVDLLKKEKLQEPRVQEYLEVLDRQSARLKKLVQDLIEASKVYTGNVTVVPEICDVNILLMQALGEFEEKMEAAELTLMISRPEKEIFILADNRYLWRIFDNLMNNICKYSQPGTRVYINLEEADGRVCIIFRNISRYQLNISSEELLERFVRGDSSRNTEGNGLGLSIVQKLAELMGGELALYIDGDLFKAMIAFTRVEGEEEGA